MTLSCARRGRGAEPAFFLDLEANLLRLSSELRSRAFRPDPYRHFYVYTRKRRLVSEASFRDRIVHHSLVTAMEPVFESSFIAASYACRKGKGTHCAIARAERLCRKRRFFLKLDVRSYFSSIDHDVLRSLLAAEIEDEGILWLCGALMDAASPGRGLPIGNLTSQFWANVYLDPLDRHVTGCLGFADYLRYMDDMLLFGDDKQSLWSAAEDIGDFIGEKLGLALKRRVTRLAPVSEGIGWLGFMIFPGMTRVDPVGRCRFGRKIAASMRRASLSWPCQEDECARAAGLCGHLEHADAHSLRRGVIGRVAGRRSGASNGY